MRVRVRFEVDFEVTEGTTELSSDKQFALCEELMATLHQGQVILQGADPLMDEPTLVLEPRGWAVDTDLWGDLRVGTCMGGIADEVI